MSESNPEKIVTINRVYPTALETRHANNVVVQHDQDNFFLSFFDVWAPIIVGTDEEKEKQIASIDHIDAKCVARIVLSPTRAQELIELLAENVLVYKSRFNLGHNEETECSMLYNLANFPASASSPVAYVQKAPERNREKDGHSFLGYSSATGTGAFLWLYQGDAVIAEYPVISKLRGLFIFCDDSVIISFFSQHQDLAAWLVRGQAVLAKHFGADTKFLLKPAHRIADDDHPRMVVYIQTHLPVADAMARLDAFDEEWLLDQIDFIGNKIIFNLAPL